MKLLRLDRLHLNLNKYPTSVVPNGIINVCLHIKHIFFFLIKPSSKSAIIYMYNDSINFNLLLLFCLQPSGERGSYDRGELIALQAVISSTKSLLCLYRTNWIFASMETLTVYNLCYILLLLDLITTQILQTPARVNFLNP